MIPSNIVKEKTGFTSSQLYHMRKLGLIPRPTRIPTAGHGGSTYAYSATVFNRIRLIKILRAKGIPLAQIARQVRGTPLACPDPGPPADEQMTHNHRPAAHERSQTMTSQSVPAILDAILDPLASIQEQVQAALELAQQCNLPRPFLDTIQGAVANLDITWEALNEIATTLDPDRGKPQP